MGPFLGTIRLRSKSLPLSGCMRTGVFAQLRAQCRQPGGSMGKAGLQMVAFSPLVPGIDEKQVLPVLRAEASHLGGQPFGKDGGGAFAENDRLARRAARGIVPGRANAGKAPVGRLRLDCIESGKGPEIVMGVETVQTARFAAQAVRDSTARSAFEIGPDFQPAPEIARERLKLEGGVEPHIPRPAAVAVEIALDPDEIGVEPFGNAGLTEKIAPAVRIGKLVGVVDRKDRPAMDADVAGIGEGGDQVAGMRYRVRVR